MEDQHGEILNQTHLLVGTAGGVITAVAALSWESVERTIVLAAIGALVSYTVSKFCGWLWMKAFNK